MNECTLCGSSEVKIVAGAKTVSFRGVELSIKADAYTSCVDCGEEYYTAAQAKELDRKIVQAYRASQNLLSGKQIKAIRSALYLSQKHLEDALGLGPKTVVRWENDTQVQGKSLDNVMRLIELDPDNLRLIVRLRNAALAPQLDIKLPEDLKSSAGIRTAIYAGLENSAVNLDHVQQIAEAVFDALTQYKQERMLDVIRGAQVAV